MRDLYTKHVHEHDTTLHVWTDDKNGLPVVRNKVVRHLRDRGFRIDIDPDTLKHFRAISKNHHRGRKGDLEVKLSLCGFSLEIVFFQNMVHDNPNGGEYDFDRREKMPYLLGKRYELERNRLFELLQSLGWSVKREVKRNGADFIEHKRQELEDFQGKGFYARPVPEYNSGMARGGHVHDGMPVWYVSRWRSRGRWVRGIARANINNMWWVLMPGGVWDNVASFKLHRREDIESLRGRHFEPRYVEKRLRAELQQAIEGERFERAAVLSDVIRKRFPAPQQERVAA